MNNDDFLNTNLPETAKTFVSDYKYVSKEDIKKITVSQLAKLEADLHSLRLVLVAGGGNPDILIAPNKTLRSEIEKVTNTLETLEQYFDSVISDES